MAVFMFYISVFCIIFCIMAILDKIIDFFIW